MWVYKFSGGTNILAESHLPITLPQKRTDLPNACLFRFVMSPVSSFALVVCVIQSRFGSDEPAVLFMPGHSPLQTLYCTNHAHAVMWCGRGSAEDYTTVVGEENVVVVSEVNQS